ncbi:MAG: MscS Mechanosensitive ion channel [Methanomicrobiales archaeon 53_19]|uniref:mechanosensitive ion channel family protein n=1 Tax=Methanocalculus sp. TaxID=2004547 RepID=UPI00074AF658|nr:mechanosensitive ion channel family protein [Methanocalculus sp.]KUK70095.1 MAG: MscS Mechanosensitive ion channel [Methanocalculus sp. 52_23]KUL03572.1 MAG: MscS Mechanosensitive ion channel [Methanomicrobiales archaeon 53_19]HIJ06415.1 mechanosensitive ion channel family protein [Methanocalculus sp.]
MKKSYIVLCVFVTITVALFISDHLFPSPLLAQLFTTLLWITGIFFILSILLDGLIRRKITDSRSRYTATKLISIIELVLILATIALIWVNDIQALMVFFGIIGAGIAIALQDLFKNFGGSLTILLTGTYSVGDRIEIDGRYGDVMDIGIMNTTMMEIRGWVAGDQATGRLIIIPNGKILTESVQNFTRDHSFLWDEIQIPVTNDSDWKRAVTILTSIVEEETNEISQIAEKEIERIGEKFFLPKKDISPAVYITQTDNWILLSVRFVTYARERREVRSRLNRLIIEAFEGEQNIEIGSESMSVQLTDQT